MQKNIQFAFKKLFNRVKGPQGKGYHQQFQIYQSQYNLG